MKAEKFCFLLAVTFTQREKTKPNTSTSTKSRGMIYTVVLNSTIYFDNLRKSKQNDDFMFWIFTLKHYSLIERAFRGVLPISEAKMSGA